MATPLPTGDPARAALDLSDEILARLDAATVPQGEGEVPKNEEPEPTVIPIEEQLQSIEDRLSAALDRSDKEEARRLVQEAKVAVREEKTRREEALQDAQDAFNQSLQEQGAEAEATTRAAKEVTLWTKSLNDYEEYIKSVDAFYDDAISGIDVDDGSVVTKVNPAFEQKPTSLSDLLETLERTEAAYRTRLDELKVQKQDVAQRIIDERIAAEKAKIGAT